MSGSKSSHQKSKKRSENHENSDSYRTPPKGTSMVSTDNKPLSSGTVISAGTNAVISATCLFQSRSSSATSAPSYCFLSAPLMKKLVVPVGSFVQITIPGSDSRETTNTLLCTAWPQRRDSQVNSTDTVTLNRLWQPNFEDSSSNLNSRIVKISIIQNLPRYPVMAFLQPLHVSVTLNYLPLSVYIVYEQWIALAVSSLL